MTKKHYIMLADVIKASTTEPHLCDKGVLIEKLIEKLTAENDRFDRFRFMAACK